MHNGRCCAHQLYMAAANTIVIRNRNIYHHKTFAANDWISPRIWQDFDEPSLVDEGLNYNSSNCPALATTTGIRLYAGVTLMLVTQNNRSELTKRSPSITSMHRVVII